jgi:uncharacterized glyoxalase superfamily protein PhnB
MKSLLAVAVLLVSLQLGQTSQPTKEQGAMKITPLIYMKEIEPSLKFWVDRLGFTKTVEVPDGSKLGFLILVKGSAELMIQSTASMEKDIASMVEYARPAACLYIEVSDFDDLLKRVEGAPVEVPVRTTFYGMKEIAVREPGGNIVMFAAPVAKATHP